jgi:hypothetical protein
MAGSVGLSKESLPSSLCATLRPLPRLGLATTYAL